jgi:hypothetical protein
VRKRQQTGASIQEDLTEVLSADLAGLLAEFFAAITHHRAQQEASAEKKSTGEPSFFFYQH